MMDDYISKQAALDEAQRIRRNLQVLDNTLTADKMLHGVWLLEREIEKLPAAPVREVVLCRECKNYKPGEPPAEVGWCHAWSGANLEEGFCSFAERRRDEHGNL